MVSGSLAKNHRDSIFNIARATVNVEIDAQAFALIGESIRFSKENSLTEFTKEYLTNPGFEFSSKELKRIPP
jgi:hypothetical protein